MTTENTTALPETAPYEMPPEGFKKLHICLTPEGQEYLATGKDVWYWHFAAFSKQRADDPAPAVPEGYMELSVVIVPLPSKESCIQPVLRKLAKREQELRLELADELQSLAERRANVLCLTHSPSTTTSAEPEPASTDSIFKWD